MIFIAAAVAVVLGILCLHSVRATVFVCLTVGIFQDVLRKLVPEEPVVLVVLVGMFFGIGVFGAFLRRGGAFFVPLFGIDGSLSTPVNLFLVLVALQTLVTILQYGEVIVAGIGFMSYLSPFLALLIGFYFAYSMDDVKKALSYYAAINVVVGLSVYLSFLEIDWHILKTIGSGMLIYDLGTVLVPHSGFARSAEIAAWHVAAAACFIAILASVSRTQSQRVLSALVIVFLVGAVLLTGRRKMLMELVLFATFFLSLSFVFKTDTKRVIVVAMMVIGLVSWVGVETLFPSEKENRFDLYVQRGVTVFDDAPTRFSTLGLGSIKAAIARVGVLGAGAGTASQGAYHFGSLTVTGGSGEGGLGKIVAELGVIALFLLTWMMWRAWRYCLRLLQVSYRVDARNCRVFLGLVAFLGANIPTFIVASQVYGDLFVLLVLGLVAGFIFSLPKLLIRQESARTLAMRVAVAGSNVSAQP